MTNKEKIRELARLHQGTMTNSQYLQMLYALEEMAEWKDKQMKSTLVEFMGYLTKRGFFCDGLCFDIEHQVDTFIELQ